MLNYMSSYEKNFFGIVGYKPDEIDHILKLKLVKKLLPVPALEPPILCWKKT